MEQTLLLIVIILIFILVLLIGALTLIGLRFLKLKDAQNKLETKDLPVTAELIEQGPKKMSPEVLKSLRASSHNQIQAAYCVDHKNEMSAGICSLSGESYCEHCLTSYNNMKFAKKFLDIYLSSDWLELKTIAETKEAQDQIERIYKAKKQLWEEKTLPMIVQGQYKINVETDEIESFVVILTRLEDRDLISSELSFIN